jgi:hypothetical protein
MQETEFNAVRLLIAPTGYSQKLRSQPQGIKKYNGKNHDQALNTYLYNRAKGYIEIILHNNQAGRLSNKDKLINMHRCYH